MNLDSLKGKLNQKNKNIILALAGVVIFLIVYYVGYQNISAKDEEINTKISDRSAYYNELKVYYDNIDLYKSGIYDMRNSIDGMIAKLPCNIPTEDFLVYMMEINEATGSDMLNVAFKEDELLSEFQCFINGEEVSVQGYSAGISSTSIMSYDQLKEYIDYVYEKTNNITYINSISVTYDSESAKLNASIELGKYYVKYDGCEYKPVDVPDVAIGLSDLFGTIETANTETETTENTETQNTVNN